MDEFNKRIKIDVNVNDEPVKRLRSTLDQIQNQDLGLGSREDLLKFDKMTDNLSKIKRNLAEIKVLEQQLSELSQLKTKEADEARKLIQNQIDLRLTENEQLRGDGNQQAGWFSTLSSIKSGDLGQVGQTIGTTIGGPVGAVIGKAVGDTLGKWLDDLKRLFKEAWKELGNILNFSKLSSSGARNLRMSYGFSGAQAYGFSLAQQMLGIGSEEDLYWMNTQERQQFYEVFTKYTEKYNKLYDQGYFTKLQEFNVEWQMFKQDVLMEVMQFIINNKDTIMSALNGLMLMAKGVIYIVQLINDFLKPIADSVNSIARFLNRDSTTNNTTNNTSNNVNQTISITNGKSEDGLGLSQIILQSTLAAFK